MRVLIVDDDENSRVFLSRALSRQGHQVESTANGLDALEKAASDPPDLIVADILLPGIDGFELCRRAKTDVRLRTIPLIFYTATYLEKKDEELAMQLGASRYLIKPMKPAELLTAIDEVMEAHRLEKLPVPDRPLADLERLGRMHLEALTRKLQEKVKELEREREALYRSEQRYQQLNETLEQRVKDAVEEVRAREELLVRQARYAAMGELMSSISHQWRQPLNTLALIVQELPVYYERGNLFSKEYLEGAVQKAMQVISTMSQTIDDFRNFFRPDGDNVVTFLISDALSGTVSIIEPTYSHLKLEIRVEIEEEVAAVGYPNSFSQAILNILINAKDAFLQRKAGEPLVVIRLFREGERGVLLITDNAGGIPEQVMGRLFEPYVSTKGPEAGTGIGLYMSRTVIEKNMHGTLSVRNVAGGTEFRVEI